jgi:hypothetical protein
MRQLKYFFFFFIGLALCFSPKATLLYSQSKVFQEDFHGKINAIAITPLTLPEDFIEQRTAAQKFEDLITARLKEAGFSVVGSKIYDEIWRREAETSEGYFDPISGKADKAKLKSILTRTREELISKYHIDAMLFPQIKVVEAMFVEDSAHWHGISEYLGKTQPSVWSSRRIRGTVPALSLFVRIEDNKGGEIYVKAGGIQVLSKAGFKGGFVAVPHDELLSDDKRNEWAVNKALIPFIERCKSETGSH